MCAVLRLDTENNTGGPHRLDIYADPDNNINPERVYDVLMKKHPPKQPPQQSSIIKSDTPPTEPHSVLFEAIDGQLIRNTVLRTDGAAGPSGLDAAE